MTISRPSPRRATRRRGRLIAALVGLLAVTTVWAPGAAAATESHATAGHAVPASGHDSAPSQRDTLLRTLSPGDALFNGAGARCTLGFNATDGTDVFLITAGHCTSSGDQWYADTQRTVHIGSAVASSFPGNDFAVIRYENPDLVPAGGYTLGTPYVGQPVHVITPESGILTGTVTGINMTVDWGPGGVVDDLIRTDICLPPTAGGGTPLIGEGDQALGIASGATGNCSSGASSFFQPLDEVLAMYGLTLY